MQILKLLWSKEIEDPEVRSKYQYVIELRDRLESTLAIAQDNLSKMSRKYNRHYDQKAGKRQLKVVDKALVLLHTDKNKLLMGWKGSYEVVEKLSPLDYRIRIGGKEKSFHFICSSNIWRGKMTSKCNLTMNRRFVQYHL